MIPHAVATTIDTLLLQTINEASSGGISWVGYNVNASKYVLSDLINQIEGNSPTLAVRMLSKVSSC